MHTHTHTHIHAHAYYTLTHEYIIYSLHRCVVSYQDQNLKKPYIIPLGSGSGTADEVQNLLTTDIVAYALYRVVSLLLCVCNQVTYHIICMVNLNQ